MRMTALDVQNHTFPRRLKGYDVDEVEHFRSALVEDWAALTSEAEGLRRRVRELESRIDELNAHESTLRNALVTAQGMSDDLRRTAEHEAQMRVGQAELEAEKILSGAHRQATRLAQDVRELRAMRSQLAGSVRATLETHLALLEGFTQEPDEAADAALDARLAALTSAEAPTPAEAAADDPAPAADARPEPASAPEAAAAEAAGEPGDEAPGPEPGPSRIRKLDSFVIPGGQTASRPAPASAKPEPSGPAWTILPDRR